MGQSMLEGFALYREPILPERLCTVYTPRGTRLQRIDRLPDAWRLWVATADFNFGTYFMLFYDGSVGNWTARPDEGDDGFTVRPSDDELRRTLK